MILLFNIYDKALSLLSTHSLCDSCLGRQFSTAGTATTNSVRGKTIKDFLALSLSSLEDFSSLQFLSRAGCSIASAVLNKTGIVPSSTDPCYLCSDLLISIPSLVESILPQLSSYQFSTLLVGTLLPEDFLDREKEVKKCFEVTNTEFLKQDFNREIGKLLCYSTGKDTNFNLPDLIITVKPLKNSFFIRLRSLFIYGRYNKFLRGIPQTRWFCRTCKGKGCISCNNTGKRYPESVEELIGHHAILFSGAKEAILHGGGREDIDVRMLGTGRPFVLELVHPTIREFDLQELQQLTNEFAKDKISVSEYRISSREEVKTVKVSAERSVKQYEAIIEFTDSVSDDDIQKLEQFFTNKVLDQRTPHRVAHRRSDLIRKKKVFSLECERLSITNVRAIVTCDGGCYVKELISGDEGRTIPSVSSVVSIPAFCKQLDVVNIFSSLPKDV